MSIVTMNLTIIFVIVAVTGIHALLWQRFKFNTIMWISVGAAAAYAAIAVWCVGGDSIEYTTFLVLYGICTQINIIAIARADDKLTNVVLHASDMVTIGALMGVALSAFIGGEMPIVTTAVVIFALLGKWSTRHVPPAQPVKAMYLRQ